MKLTNCNCGELIDCGCTLSFSSYVTNPISVLDVGNLVGTPCTFSEYVIDWYRNGEFYMASGVGSNPEITAFHPFTGSAAIPVISGNYTPVVRYVVLTGETTKLFPTEKNCFDWCEFTNSLPEIIVVNPLNCGVSNTGGDYQFQLSYSTTQDYALSERVIRWDLDEDAKWFAISFDAQQVADKIEIFHNDSLTPLSSWIVGTRFNTDYDTAMPYRMAFLWLRWVIELPDYAPGDYLTIRITPSVLETNTNTIWTAKFKCLPASTDWSGACATFTEDMRIVPIDTITLTNNVSLCRWELKGLLIEPFPINSYYGNLLRKYGALSLGAGQNGFVTNIATTGEVGVSLRYGKSLAFYGNGGSQTCTNSTGTIDLAYVLNIFTLTFSESAEYLSFKNDYNERMASVFGTGFINDDTNIEFYRYINMYYRKAISCGDVGSQLNFQFHITSPVTFNDGLKKITIEILNPANNFTGDATCDSRVTTINSNIALINSTISALSAYSGETKCYFTNRFRGLYPTTIISDITDTFGYYLLTIPRNTVPCVPSFTCQSAFIAYWKIFYLRAVITDTGDPENNYDVYSKMDYTTGCDLSSWLLVKRVVAGVQTYP